MCLLQFSFIALYLLKSGQASTGDRDYAFQQCVAVCESTGCVDLEPVKLSKECNVACPLSNGRAVPLTLRLFKWSCQDDCRYCCMSLRKLRTIDGLDGSAVKYFGKWPFQRLLGMQELLSVVFSLANLAAHAQNLFKLWSACSSGAGATEVNSVQGLWMVYSLTSINAWWWSAVFHARDTYVTERFDYLSADVSIMAGLYVSIVRTCACQRVHSRLLLALLLMLVTGWHFHHMLLVKFDYGFNVSVCVAIGILQQLMWCTWALRHDHPQKWQLVWFVVLINAALSLEILDFSPLVGLLDAHAMWHLCTIPLTYMWYSFVLTDVKWAVQTDPQQRSTGKQQ
ncbi:amino acid permease [Trebouxia sp. C0010 RCD-2024]